MFQDLHFVHYIPVATTVLSLIFLVGLLNHYFKGGRKPHVAWWAIGVFTYGLGTALEGSITLFGNSVFLNKFWYVAGAILGGYPLAQGSVYLHMKKRTANILSAITVPAIIIISILIFASPVDISVMQEFKPTGEILVWQKLRLFTPIINIYAVIFLIGGAFYSSYIFFKSGENPNRALGNIFIAVGAILPGIGGALVKTIDLVEALYIGEFLGIILIWFGYKMCIRKAS